MDKDYAQTVKRSKSSRRLDFQKLLDLGLIERRGLGKNTYYVVTAADYVVTAADYVKTK